jgi:hypothetical protein
MKAVNSAHLGAPQLGGTAFYQWGHSSKIAFATMMEFHAFEICLHVVRFL